MQLNNVKRNILITVAVINGASNKGTLGVSVEQHEIITDVYGVGKAT